MSLSVQVKLPDGSTYTQPTGLFINNEFVKSIKGEKFESICPATEEPIAAVYRAYEEDVDVAVKAAREAYNTVWKETGGVQRGKLLFKLAELMEKHADELAGIEAHDSGKPKATNAIFDVEESANCMRYFGGWADKVTGKSIPLGKDKFAYTLHEPYGVCGQIIPWNYPLAMAAWKLGPALAAGNCVVLKTSEITPLSMLWLANLIKEAGFPPGVVNILSGFGKDAGARLASHEGVDKIAFTGSTATGQVIQQLASKNMKAVTLECGGKSALVIFDDADLDQAAKWAAIGIMSNQGQICTATSRIYIQDGAYDKFLQAFKAHVEEEYTSKQGCPFNDTHVVGPQISQPQYEKILSYIEIGKKEGAKLLSGGKTPASLTKGYFIEPTIFADISPDMRIANEEIFGPVVACGRFKTYEEGLKYANQTQYGLGSAVFTQDIAKAHRFASDLEAGMVWINSSNDSDIHVPFGGVKMSGVGRELGEYGLTIYTQAKAVHVNMGSKL
ncbi:hypothetical protein BABINDRAFT_34633 [Babjeviella inositovora NRRL Y-12698]|uniref:Aldehyde dehydrogenase domain-containing protein n=1 Tax=Babjeviella inositovora NRRL Y-12698 TaxID=984486 RepID=A0A1E3QST0_9ASCO|nr:uncharacterized protein BABINDRAFT_34633 [Babjeviella inositovora NRRL Y-12698]ODQ80564.1 hypothetical protein BABINDRAFT_34633 [Babjeviella inositovora NRRL Y-12698]